MINFAILLRATWYQMILLLREPVGLVFGAIFSIAIVPIFTTLYGEYPTEIPGVYRRNVIAWDAIGINLAAASFITIPTNFAAQRSYGLLRLFKASPLSRTYVVLSFLLANMMFHLVFVALLLLTNEFLYGLYFPINVRSLVLLFLGFIFGAAAMIPTGLIVAAVVRSHTAVAPCGQLLFMPNLLLSGLSIPLDQSPSFLQYVSYSLPLTHVGELFTASWRGTMMSDIDSIGIFILAVYGVFFAILVCIFLRWE